MVSRPKNRGFLRLFGFLRAEDGGPAAEFAMVLMPMVILFVVIMQFGIVLFVYNDMYNAAHDAARQLASNELIVYNNNSSALDYLVGDGLSKACDGIYTPAKTVEEAACYGMTTWSNFMNFTVRIALTETLVTGACDQFTVTMAIPMADATIFNIFGIFDGLQLEAKAIMRSQYDVVEGGEVGITSGFCT